ncbi:MAG TPA: cell envelope biogenesis protein TolA [Myxococcaceae bacterium]|nr:cell envelope biogenesis protein TolA [Myxococcaceae bacterium]
MLVALILVSIGFAITLGMLLFGSNRATVAAPAPRAELSDGSPRPVRPSAEAELARKQKELDEQRSQLQDLKEQLKQTKRKLYEQKEGEKGERDLTKARTEVERNASTQLEVVRGELNQALAEIERLRGEQGGGKARRGPAPGTAVTVTATAPAAASAAAPAAAPAIGQISAPAHEGERVVTAAVQVVPVAEAAAAAPAMEKDRGPRRYRELNDADREKMERLEQSAKKDRERAVELERELRKLKGGRETQQRIYTATKGELDLVKDKFKALEKRLNRTLLERDLLRRAIKDLEKKTGMLADRTELTPEEVAASDQKSDEAARERANAEAQRAAQQAQAEAEAAKASEAPAAAPSEAPAAAAGEADKSSAPSA